MGSFKFYCVAVVILVLTPVSLGFGGAPLNLASLWESNFEYLDNLDVNEWIDEYGIEFAEDGFERESYTSPPYSPYNDFEDTYFPLYEGSSLGNIRGKRMKSFFGNDFVAFHGIKYADQPERFKVRCQKCKHFVNKILEVI